MNTRTAPRTPNDWGWQFEASRYLPYVARYSRGQVASAWGGGLEGIFAWQVPLKINTNTAAGISEILKEGGVYRLRFERAAFGIRADGFPNAGARATERRVDVQIDAGDVEGVGVPAGCVAAVAKRPCRPRRATWTKCHDRTVFVKDRDTLLFKKIGTAQNFEKFLGPRCILRPSWPPSAGSRT